MTRTEAKIARDLESLMVLLTAYQDELARVAHDAPAVTPLREAVGEALAEARGCLLAQAPMRGAGIH
jgi:hypothetical protein